MREKYDLSWDSHRPVLHEYLGSGLWDDEDDADYLDLLSRVLADAPPAGFDVLSDARGYTMQDATLSDEPAYRMIAEAGGRRFIQVVGRSVIALQAARIIRESGVAGQLSFHRVTTMAEAEELLG